MYQAAKTLHEVCYFFEEEVMLPEDEIVFQSIQSDCDRILRATDQEIRKRKLQMLGAQNPELKEAIKSTAELMTKQGLGNLSMTELLQIMTQEVIIGTTDRRD